MKKLLVALLIPLSLGGCLSFNDTAGAQNHRDRSAWIDGRHARGPGRR